MNNTLAAFWVIFEFSAILLITFIVFMRIGPQGFPGVFAALFLIFYIPLAYATLNFPTKDHSAIKKYIIIGVIVFISWLFGLHGIIFLPYFLVLILHFIVRPFILKYFSKE